MGNFSESKQPGSSSTLIRAIAYYRQSTQNRQDESLAKQQEQVRRWAAENGVEIIREFCDTSPANTDCDERPAFTEMLDDWIKKRSDFEYVLCLDASRWGRLVSTDITQQSKKQVIYTSDGNRCENEASKEVCA